MGFFSNNKKKTGRVKKQVIIDPQLHLRIKSKLALQGRNFSEWVEEKVKEELKK